MPVLTYPTKKDVLGERRDYDRRHIDGCVPRWIRGRNSFVIWLLRPEKGEAIEIARLTDYAPTGLYSPLRGQGALRCAPVIITKGTGEAVAAGALSSRSRPDPAPTPMG